LREPIFQPNSKEALLERVSPRGIQGEAGRKRQATEVQNMRGFVQGKQGVDFAFVLFGCVPPETADRMRVVQRANARAKGAVG
jgi:hypothetical protein